MCTKRDWQNISLFLCLESGNNYSHTSCPLIQHPTVTRKRDKKGTTYFLRIVSGHTHTAATRCFGQVKKSMCYYSLVQFVHVLSNPYLFERHHNLRFFWHRCTSTGSRAHHSSRIVQMYITHQLWNVHWTQLFIRDISGDDTIFLFWLRCKKGMRPPFLEERFCFAVPMGLTQ
jgi:hypothetical protein